MSEDRTVNRRAVLGGVVVIGATGLVTAACGSSTSAPSAGATNSTAGSGTPTPATSTGAQVLGQASSVPVGGGAIFPDQKVVVTQPTAGQYLGFSSLCTHQGCQVTSVQDGFIVCPCHDSMFAIATGDPTPDSPANRPLAKVDVAVKNGNIVST